MADRIDIAVKLEEQSELHAFRVGVLLDKYAVRVQFLLQDLCSEPFRYQRHLKVRAEIYNTVSIERAGFTLGIQRDGNSAGDRLRCTVGKGLHTICDRLSQLGGMNVFQIVFDFITHVLILRFE